MMEPLTLFFCLSGGVYSLREEGSHIVFFAPTKKEKPVGAGKDPTTRAAKQPRGSGPL